MFKIKEIDVEEQRLDLYADHRANFWVISHDASPEKIRVSEANPIGPNYNGFSSKKGKIIGSSSMEPQDADYDTNSNSPQLMDDVQALILARVPRSEYYPQLMDDVQALILARVPRSEYWKFPFVNKRFLSLLTSGELYKIRREIGFKEPSVFVRATGKYIWWTFDRQFSSRRKLPDLPSDDCIVSSDKETLCAGTHFLVSGKELDGISIWRYKLETNKWSKGPYMINPRCLFANATCGTFACVAGGMCTEISGGTKVLNSAERYNPETESWELLPNMNRKRKSCSGFYMDNKFYVIGGINEEGGALTCGEYLDEEKSKWELIPNMLDVPHLTSYSPPLIAVANNELYSLETSTNELKVFMKKCKAWKKLGRVPVKAGLCGGWGVAFKSLGNELLVIGGSSNTYGGNGMSIYTCCPDPQTESLQWMPVETELNGLGNFVYNCCVMVA